jgi:predicted nucleotidyltransferase
MNDIILSKLTEIQKEHNIKILYAVELGSRGWGFASKDSDFDVRFIYVRPTDWYLSVDERNDFIELPINDLLDINGWDLKKTLLQYKKSNPTLLEWFSSPIVYLECGIAAEKLRNLLPSYFSPVHTVQMLKPAISI